MKAQEIALWSAGVATALGLGYLVYFDYKRRNDPAFRKHLSMITADRNDMHVDNMADGRVEQRNSVNKLPRLQRKRKRRVRKQQSS